jgi:hypothetical protein
VALDWIKRWRQQHSSVSLDTLFREFLESRLLGEKYEQSIGYTKARFKRRCAQSDKGFGA